MAGYTVSTNLISWILARRGWFGWPNETGVEKHIAEMEFGDMIVPKFAQSASYEADSSHGPYQHQVAEVFEVDYDEALASYEKRIAQGAGAVPFVMGVTSPSFTPPGAMPRNIPWSCVEVELLDLPHPISTSEYLRLRAIPVAVAIQFKATVARGRHVQPLPAGAAQAVVDAGQIPNRGTDVLRTESLVRADTVTEAAAALSDAGVPPRRLDRAFVANSDRMVGLCVCRKDGELEAVGEPIERPPSSLTELFTAAAKASKNFRAQRPLHAAVELAELLSGDEPVRVAEEFGRFHDRYVLLTRKVNEALELEAHPGPEPATDGPPPAEDDDGEATVEELAIEQVQGLGISAVREALPPGVVIEDAVLAETVTALRAGKHLILSGPPGTGKSTLATAVCRAVGTPYRMATATADWSTVDTIGAYLPDGQAGLAFEEGVVLTALAEDAWLVIDELNRADIDKAFGPLFTLLAGAGGSGAETVTLPYRRDGERIEIGWATTRSKSTTAYAVTQAWRLIGTMNDSDKSSLFGLSFAFLRRFAVIDVGLPNEATYRELIAARLPTASQHDPAQLLDAAMRAAHGPILLGPAILLDVAEFTRRGVTTTATGKTPYETAVDAFLTAVRLYAVPQYEGAEHGQILELKKTLHEVFPEPPPAPWARLDAALSRAAISAA